MLPLETSKRILIVGGSGRMGQMFQRFLSERGHQIDSLEKDDVIEKKRISSADIVLIAVPMSIATQIARIVAPLLRPDALLLDINSLKSEICRTMKELCQGECLGLHPMFGPTVTNLHSQNFIVCPVRSGPLSQYFLGELKALGAVITYSSPERHDHMMGIIQVLVHFNTMVMGETLRKSDASISETLGFTSPIYKLELSLIGRLFAQDPALYQEILLKNPSGKMIRRLFFDSAAEMAEILDRNDKEAFQEHFMRCKEYFSNFAEDAMKLSDQIIEKVLAN